MNQNCVSSIWRPTGLHWITIDKTFYFFWAKRFTITIKVSFQYHHSIFFSCEFILFCIGWVYIHHKIDSIFTNKTNLWEWKTTKYYFFFTRFIFVVSCCFGVLYIIIYLPWSLVFNHHHHHHLDSNNGWKNGNNWNHKEDCQFTFNLIRFHWSSQLYRKPYKSYWQTVNQPM